MSRLVLHACCGPCLLEPLDALASQAEQLVVLFVNPNIHGVDEYERRRDSLFEYAESEGIEVIELEYEPERWAAEVGRFGDDIEQRCRACYRQRLAATARWAAEHGFDSFATTLTVSPYQDAAAIAEEGNLAGSEAGVTYVDRDFRDRFSEATKRSRDLGMYRQRYCGCHLSQASVERERRARKAARANR